MKRLLIKTKKYKLFHIVNGVEIDGEKPNMAGDCTGLRGDCTGLWGNLDDCNISDDERKNGINITGLVEV